MRPPGVTAHNHAAPPGEPAVNLNALVIIGNYISGNGADTQDATTPGSAGINIYGIAGNWATEIMENTIINEAFDVVMNNPGSMDMLLHNLLAAGVGGANLGRGPEQPKKLALASIPPFGAAGCITASGSGRLCPSRSSATVATAPTGAKARP
jgi:hypothetical protein